MRRTCLALLTVIGLAGGAHAQEGGQAEVPRGLWQTEPDGFGVVLHVRTRRCGRALCGRVERAKNRQGYDTPSDAVGDKVFWEMRPQPDGTFFGEYRGPRARRFPQSRVTVTGSEMRLDACTDAACTRRILTRIR